MKKGTKDLLKITESKRYKGNINTNTKKPIHVRIEDWAKGTLAPFICRTMILGLATWGLYTALQYIEQLPEFVKGSVATVVIAGLIAGASHRRK